MCNKVKDYPSLDQIRADYKCFIEKTGHITTIEDALPLYKEFDVIEANGDDINKYIAEGGTNEGLEWLRYERYGCLDYIYVFIKNGKVDYVSFDVWCDEGMVDFIDSITIDKLTEEVYSESIKAVEKFFN